MTDLETFGAHARAMSTAEHKPDCAPRDRRPRWINVFDADGVIGEGHYDPPRCPGCVTSTDRALWARLADEVDDYMGRDAQEGLFG